MLDQEMSVGTSPVGSRPVCKARPALMWARRCALAAPLLRVMASRVPTMATMHRQHRMVPAADQVLHQEVPAAHTDMPKSGRSTGFKALETLSRGEKRECYEVKGRKVCNVEVLGREMLHIMHWPVPGESHRQDQLRAGCRQVADRGSAYVAEHAVLL